MPACWSGCRNWLVGRTVYLSSLFVPSPASQVRARCGAFAWRPPWAAMPPRPRCEAAELTAGVTSSRCGCSQLSTVTLAVSSFDWSKQRTGQRRLVPVLRFGIKRRSLLENPLAASGPSLFRSQHEQFQDPHPAGSGHPRLGRLCRHHAHTGDQQWLRHLRHPGWP